MWKKTKFVVLALVLLLAFGSAAHAGLAEVGPQAVYTINGQQVNGFPLYYKDTNGVIVELPAPINPLNHGNGVDPPTMIYDPVITGDPLSAATGFGSEAFYWIASADFPFKDGRVTVTLALEAAYASATGDPDPTQMVVFGRIRVRAPVRTAGTYKFYHPYGVETITVTADDIRRKRGVNFTNDHGFIPGNFTAVLSAPIGPFLRAVNPAPPAGWIGDGATPTTVTGSPINYNKVRLEAPAGVDLDGLKNNFVETTLFVVSGHIPGAVPAALSVDRASCSHMANVNQEIVDVFATSSPTATLTVKGSSIPSTIMTGDGTGKFFAHIVSTGPKATSVNVTASDPPKTDKTVTQNVTDVVTIDDASYNAGSQTLTILASSSVDGVTLTAAGLGNLTTAINAAGGTTGNLVIPSLVAPPPEVTVSSSNGGSAKATVVVVP